MNVIVVTCVWFFNGGFHPLEWILRLVFCEYLAQYAFLWKNIFCVNLEFVFWTKYRLELIHVYEHCRFVMRDLQNEKRDHPPTPPLTLCWSRGCQNSCHIIPNIPKNGSNKSFWDLNFLRQSQWAHMSISPLKWNYGAPTLTCLKYYNVLKHESRFILALNTAKNTYYIKKIL